MRHIAKLVLAASAVMAPHSAASAETIFGLVDSGSIVTFDSANPGVITGRSSVTGVAPGDRLLGIDLRPATNQLYSVGASGTVYLIAQTGAGQFTATAQGTTNPAPSGSSFGFDFNPVPDRLRLISDTNQNLRIDVRPPVGTTVDGTITLNGTPNIDIVGSAYTNNFAGATSTILYGLDAFNDALVQAAAPAGSPPGSVGANLGTYVLVGPLGPGITFTSTDRVGFDISGATGQGFLNINDQFYSINLTSGAASLIGNLGAPGIVGLTAAAAVPEPATWAMMLLGFGAVGHSLRRRPAAGAPRLALGELHVSG